MGENDDHVRAGDQDSGRGASWLSRALRLRVPVWLVLAAFVVVAGSFAVALLMERRSSVELGPAVGTAERIEVQMTLCNHDVDRLQLNPRRAELDLEDVLRDQGAGAADVKLDRRDCPRQKAGGAG